MNVKGLQDFAGEANASTRLVLFTANALQVMKSLWMASLAKTLTNAPRQAAFVPMEFVKI